MECAHLGQRRLQVRERLAGRLVRPEEELHYTNAERLEEFDLQAARDYARVHAAELSAGAGQAQQQPAAGAGECAHGRTAELPAAVRQAQELPLYSRISAAAAAQPPSSSLAGAQPGAAAAAPPLA